MRRKATVHNVSKAVVARSRVYRAALDNLTRHGLTKTQLTDAVMVALGDQAPSRITVQHYLKAAVYFGLLDAYGNSARRKYYPPDSIKLTRRANVRDGKDSLRDQLTVQPG